jgi:hypothetical protein
MTCSIAYSKCSQQAEEVVIYNTPAVRMGPDIGPEIISSPISIGAYSPLFDL